MLVINPGSGPVNSADRTHATDNMAQFVKDLADGGINVTSIVGAPNLDYNNDDHDGRFAFQLAMADGRTVEIQMPGLPLDQVRWMDEDGQNIWDFPRLYVDGSSWVWYFALSCCRPDEY